MYIRIQDNIIRYRISKVESQQLLSGEVLIGKVLLSNTSELIYSITPISNPSYFNYSDKESSLNLQVNTDELMNEIKDRPSKSGIKINNRSASSASIYLEIDLKKQKT